MSEKTLDYDKVSTVDSGLAIFPLSVLEYSGLAAAKTTMADACELTLKRFTGALNADHSDKLEFYKYYSFIVVNEL